MNGLTKSHVAWKVIGLILPATLAVGQNAILVESSSGNVLAAGVYGEVYNAATLTIIGANSSSRDLNVKFKLDSILGAPLVVSPSSGTTPAEVHVGVNPKALLGSQPYARFQGVLSFTTVDQSPPRTDIARITLTIGPPPAPPNITAVVNSASSGAGVSPGSMATILGVSLGPPILAADYNTGGLYPLVFGATTVKFNGIYAPLLYVSQSRIDAVVPYAVTGQKSADVVVEHYGQISSAFSVPIVDTSPAIFTAGKNAILNSDYSYNSADNPAAPGSVVVLYATGAGPWDPGVPDAGISLVAKTFSAQPVSLTIGGQPATLLYVGAAPYQNVGVLQVNAVVPCGAASGPQPIVLKIGDNDNSQQRVTLAVQ